MGEPSGCRGSSGSMPQRSSSAGVRDVIDPASRKDDSSRRGVGGSGGWELGRGDASHCVDDDDEAPPSRPLPPPVDPPDAVIAGRGLDLSSEAVRNGDGRVERAGRTTKADATRTEAQQRTRRESALVHVHARVFVVAREQITGRPLVRMCGDGSSSLQRVRRG